MTENGNNKGNGDDAKRDEKGRFLPGHSGGPGRGKKSDGLDLTDADFWEATEKVIRRDMESGSDSTRMKATGLYLKWQSMKDDYERKENAKGNKCINQDTLNLLRLLNALGLETGMNGSEVLAKMVEVCPGCKRLGGKPVLNVELPDFDEE